MFTIRFKLRAVACFKCENSLQAVLICWAVAIKVLIRVRDHALELSFWNLSFPLLYRCVEYAYQRVPVHLREVLSVVTGRHAQ